MRINNKGFAISSIMYLILVFALILMVTTLALLSSRKLILDKMKKNVSIDINSDSNFGDPTVIPDGYLCAKSSSILVSTSPYEEYLDTYVCNVAYDESSNKYTKYTFYKLGVSQFNSSVTRLILSGYYDAKKYSYYDAESKMSNLANSWNLTSGVTLPFLEDDTYGSQSKVNIIANTYWLFKERLTEDQIKSCESVGILYPDGGYRYPEVVNGILYGDVGVCPVYSAGNKNFIRPVIEVPTDKIKN